MFMNHFTEGGEWSDERIKGVRRFINKFYSYIKSEDGEDTLDVKAFEDKIYDLFTKWKVNKVVSEWMILLNSLQSKKLTKETKLELVNLFETIFP